MGGRAETDSRSPPSPIHTRVYGDKTPVKPQASLGDGISQNGRQPREGWRRRFPFAHTAMGLLAKRLGLERVLPTVWAWGCSSAMHPWGHPGVTGLLTALSHGKQHLSGPALGLWAAGSSSQPRGCHGAHGGGQSTLSLLTSVFQLQNGSNYTVLLYKMPCKCSATARYYHDYVSSNPL